MPKLIGTAGPDILDRRGYNDDWTIDGRGDNDTIYGGNGRDALKGGVGDDLIYASADDASISGGAGVDTVSFFYSGTGVRVELSNGGLGLWPDTSPTTVRPRVLANIENVIGSSFDDFLAGNRFVNELDGGAGNDRFLPSGTGDFLTGGTGADKYYFGNVSKTVTITDFHYNEGDRIVGQSVYSWVEGEAPDADGNLQSAWIGTVEGLEVIVLGADTAPSAAWFVLN